MKQISSILTFQCNGIRFNLANPIANLDCVMVVTIFNQNQPTIINQLCSRAQYSSFCTLNLSLCSVRGANKTATRTAAVTCVVIWRLSFVICLRQTKLIVVQTTTPFCHLSPTLGPGPGGSARRRRRIQNRLGKK